MNWQRTKKKQPKIEFLAITKEHFSGRSEYIWVWLFVLKVKYVPKQWIKSFYKHKQGTGTISGVISYCSYNILSDDWMVFLY